MDFILPTPLNGQVLYDSTYFQRHAGKSLGAKRLRIQQGKNEIDDVVLGGGVDRGIVMGLSSGTATQDGIECVVGRILYLNLISTTLMNDKNARVCIIDTTGSLSVLLVQKCLQHSLQQEKLERSSGHLNSRIKSEIDKQISEILERIEISRVFDLEGLWEVLREIDNTGQSDEVHPTQSQGSFIDLIAEAENATPEALPPFEGEVDYSSDLEMLASSPPWPSQLSVMATPPARETIKSPEVSDTALQASLPRMSSQISPQSALQSSPMDPVPVLPHAITTSNAPPIQRMDLVVIDNMTSLITELFFRIERQTAHKTLTALSRTLNTLASTNNRTFLLLNTLTNPQTPIATTNGVFSSHLSPSLGKLFAHIPALHLFIHAIPKTVLDADLAYASEEGRKHSEKGGYGQGVRCVQVLEVLKDTCASYVEGETRHAEDSWTKLQAARGEGLRGREQKWCGFELVVDDSWTAVGVKDVSSMN